jgi:hypothetical protein
VRSLIAIGISWHLSPFLFVYGVIDVVRSDGSSRRLGISSGYAVT